MSSNVGLSTPRGSGTSGFVQRNLAHMKPRDYGAPYPQDPDRMRHKQRQPDQEILDHEAKREIEVKVFDLRDKLEDEGLVVSTLPSRLEPTPLFGFFTSPSLRELLGITKLTSCVTTASTRTRLTTGATS